jgi:hypothetical protein
MCTTSAPSNIRLETFVWGTKAKHYALPSLLQITQQNIMNNLSLACVVGKRRHLFFPNVILNFFYNENLIISLVAIVEVNM